MFFDTADCFALTREELDRQFDSLYENWLEKNDILKNEYKYTIFNGTLFHHTTTTCSGKLDEKEQHRLYIAVKREAREELVGMRFKNEKDLEEEFEGTADFKFACFIEDWTDRKIEQYRTQQEQDMERE